MEQFRASDEGGAFPPQPPSPCRGHRGHTGTLLPPPCVISRRPPQRKEAQFPQKQPPTTTVLRHPLSGRRVTEATTGISAHFFPSLFPEAFSVSLPFKSPPEMGGDLKTLHSFSHQRRRLWKHAPVSRCLSRPGTRWGAVCRWRVLGCSHPLQNSLVSSHPFPPRVPSHTSPAAYFPSQAGASFVGSLRLFNRNGVAMMYHGSNIPRPELLWGLEEL